MLSSQTSNATDTTSVCSEASTLLEGVPDRHGFLGGSQYSPDPRQGPSPETVLRREQKWLRMLNKWETYMDKNYRKVHQSYFITKYANTWIVLNLYLFNLQVRERCRKGIPMSVRPKAWLYLCGGKILMDKNPGMYQKFCEQPGDSKSIDEIRKDLHRQFPHHEMFVTEDRPGQQELFNLLKAYCMWNPEEG